MKRVTALCLATLIVGMAADPAAAQTPGKAIIERVLVRVNGEIFTQSQLTQRQVDELRKRNQQNPNAGDAALRTALSEITPDVLVAAIDELLLVQRGRELKLSYTETQFQEMVENIKKENNLDDAGLKRALDQEGLTMELLRKNFETAYFVHMVQREEIGRRMNLTQEELRQYYRANQDDFMTDETVMLREILVLVPTRTEDGQEVSSPQDEAAAGAKMDAIVARVRGGESFAAVASDVSESGTKANGGLIGPVKVSDINPVFAGMIAKLSPGEIGEPIRVPRGLQLIRLESREPAALKAFDEVRNELEMAIYEDRLAGETEKLLQRLRTRALIEWKDETLREIYEKRLVQKQTE